jgi:hypothetical protein
MDDSFGYFGWQEFNENRNDILLEYDKVFRKSTNKPIKVAHGVAVEAYIREWLNDFLPNKFGVTSGYVVPDLFNTDDKLYHFDVIIYDKINSPVLWTDSNKDDSENGKSRAIPARHVVHILEIKSRLNVSNVNDAIGKLSQINIFKDYLHNNFKCGLIFIDHLYENNKKTGIMQSLTKINDLYNFANGLILRYESDDSAVGLITTTIEEVKNKKKIQIAKRIDDIDIYHNELGEVKLVEENGGVHLKTINKKIFFSIQYHSCYSYDNKAVDVSWSRKNFSHFAVTLLNTLEGKSLLLDQIPTYGMFFDKIKFKPTPEQGINKSEDLPFLKVSLESNENFEQKIVFDNNKYSFKIFIVNQNEKEATVFFGSRKNSFSLQYEDAVVKKLLFIHKPRNVKSFEKLQKIKPQKIPISLFYYPKDNPDQLRKIVKTIILHKNKLKFES